MTWFIPRGFAALLVIGSFVGILAACEEKGPAEEVGEAIDDAAEEAGDAVEDATN